MHQCECGLTFECEQALATHRVFCKYGVYAVVAVLVFLLFAGVFDAAFADAGIFNGGNAPRQPYMAKVQSVAGSCGGVFIESYAESGGGLVSLDYSDWVLTAKHCVSEAGWTKAQVIASMTVRTCEYNLEEVTGCEQVLTATDIFSMPDRDIALIRLTTPVQVVMSGTETVVDFLPLPAEITPTMGSTVTMYGWGAQSVLGVRTPILQGGVMTVTEVLTFKFCAEGTTFAGKGDSGGPAFVNGVLMGVTSTGRDGYTCFSRPGGWVSKMIVAAGEPLSNAPVVYLPLIINGPLAAIGDGPDEPAPTATPTPTPLPTLEPVPGITPRAER